MGADISLSPLDGRYREKVQDLSRFFSESALIKYRIVVESLWLIKLSKVPQFKSQLKLTPPQNATLDKLSKLSDAAQIHAATTRVKEIERTTNHDVKAVEYFLREELNTKEAGNNAASYIHFACTSEDINNLAYSLMMRDAHRAVVAPEILSLLDTLSICVSKFAGVPMLSRTHGQSASPTTMGKELGVFLYRLARKMHRLNHLKFVGKMNGAVGNYNAHYASFPEIDWPELARDFIENDLKLSFNPLTTQIENHDHLVEYFEALSGFNQVLIGFNRDIWAYISLGYFKQKAVAGEVGSSTMPHKVNPIDFENSEGNLGIANALSRHLSEKLPISRWQRDLTDSTVLRSIGTVLGHSLLAYKGCIKGISKLELEHGTIERDLRDNPEVLAEAVQTIMRKHGVSDAYERLKTLTRGQKSTRDEILKLIQDSDEISLEDKTRLKSLSMENYLGIAADLARTAIDVYKKLRNP